MSSLYALNNVHMFSVAPNATITGLQLAPEWVNVTWALFAGDVISLQLRHTSVASMDVIIPVSSWTVLKDNIKPDQNNVFVNDTTFDVSIHNLFIMVSFEDEHLEAENHFTGVQPTSVIEPIHSSSGKNTFCTIINFRSLCILHF